MPLNIHLPTAGLIGVSALRGAVINDDTENPFFEKDSVTIIEGTAAKTITVPNPAVAGNEDLTNGSVIIFKLKTEGSPLITLTGQEATVGGVTSKVPLEGSQDDTTVSTPNSIVTLYYVGQQIEGGKDWGWVFGPGTI